MKNRIVFACLSILALAAAPAVMATGYPQPQAQGLQMGVSVVDDMFVGRNITVTPGTTVVWKNMGQHPHTVTAQNGLFESGNLPPGGIYSFTFQAPGTYSYRCRFHQGMTGTITVTAAGAGYGYNLSGSYSYPPASNYNPYYLPPRPCYYCNNPYGSSTYSYGYPQSTPAYPQYQYQFPYQNQYSYQPYPNQYMYPYYPYGQQLGQQGTYPSNQYTPYPSANTPLPPGASWSAYNWDTGQTIYR